MERVLVVILCETRAHEFTFDAFKQNLLKVLNADLCLCVADNEREDTRNPFYQHAKHMWRFDEPNDWGDAFDYAQRVDGHTASWRRILGIKEQWLGGILGEDAHPGSAGIILFFRWFLKHSILKHDILGSYDRFVLTRSDYVHKIPHVPLKFLDPAHVWIPDGESYGGYTDRHTIASREDILSVLSVTDPILADPDGLYSRMEFFDVWNLEKYLKFAFDQSGVTPKIRGFPYTMYTVRAPDGHGRWKMGDVDLDLGYCIKYPKELIRSQLASELIRTPSDWTPESIKDVEDKFSRDERITRDGRIFPVWEEYLNA